MMKYILKITTVLLVFGFLFVSCIDDLDTTPIDPDETTANVVFDDPAAYKAFLAKLYAGLAISGQEGPAGRPDITGIDEGFGQYLRAYWYHQELTTDEAVIGWDDQTIKDFHWHEWGTSDNFIAAQYYRIYYQIALVNEFLRSTTEGKLNERGESDQIKAEVAAYRIEARFLRALSYWHALDLFGGGVPFVTEDDPVGFFMPEPISKADLFDYIEEQLLDIEDEITPVGQAEYGRADQGAVWTLLTKIYLNAEVYINEEKYTEAITYSKKVIDSDAYELVDDYSHLFLADNNNLPEVIFPIVYDGIQIRTYGGTNFIIHAAVGGDMPPSDYGVGSGWGGTRTTSALVDKFMSDEEYPGYLNENNQGKDEIYVPGDYQPTSGYDTEWDPATAAALIETETDSVYAGYVYIGLQGAEFKFTEERNWDAAWGYDTEEGELSMDGGNMSINFPGMYYFEVDLREDKLTVQYNLDVNFADSRDIFYTYNQTREIENLSDFQQGYAVGKFKNVTSTGEQGSSSDHPDTDFPMFRLADVYLMYAEAVLRGGSGGDEGTAVSYINMLRERAYGDASGNINAGDLTLDFILDERARELYWECHRRTDLRRYDLLTGGDYLWSWKGNAQNGRATDSKYNLFPLPSSDVHANTNLVQNPNY